MLNLTDQHWPRWPPLKHLTRRNKCSVGGRMSWLWTAAYSHSMLKRTEEQNFRILPPTVQMMRDMLGWWCTTTISCCTDWHGIGVKLQHTWWHTAVVFASHYQQKSDWIFNHLDNLRAWDYKQLLLHICKCQHGGSAGWILCEFVIHSFRYAGPWEYLD